MADDTDVGAYSDLELEQQVLRYIAITDSSLIPHIDENIFYGSDERVIFDILKTLQTTFSEKLLKQVILKRVGSETYKEVEPTILDMFKSPKIGTYNAAKILLKDLQDLYIQRSIIEYAEAASNFAKEEQIEDAMDSIHSIIRTETRQKIDSGGFLEDFEEREAIVKANAEKKDEKAALIPTGVINFDKVTGGIKKGEVGILVAQTGLGKSMAKLNFSTHAFLKGFNVAFFGLEMSKHENEFRADSILANIPASMFRMSQFTEREYTKWKGAINDLKKNRKNFFEFIGAKSLTLTEIFSVADGIENKYSKAIDLMIIDHVVLIKSEGKYRDFHSQHWDTMDRVTDYAVNMNKAIWSSTQSTDEGISRKKGMRVIDVKYAKAFSEYANILIALYQSDIDKVSGDLNFAVRKGRGVPTGLEIMLKPDFSRLILDQHSFALHNEKLLESMGSGRRKGKNKSRIGRM